MSTSILCQLKTKNWFFQVQRKSYRKKPEKILTITNLKAPVLQICEICILLKNRTQKTRRPTQKQVGPSRKNRVKI